MGWETIGVGEVDQGVGLVVVGVLALVNPLEDRDEGSASEAVEAKPLKIGTFVFVQLVHPLHFRITLEDGESTFGSRAHLFDLSEDLGEDGGVARIIPIAGGRPTLSGLRRFFSVRGKRAARGEKADDREVRADLPVGGCAVLAKRQMNLNPWPALPASQRGIQRKISEARWRGGSGERLLPRRNSCR